MESLNRQTEISDVLDSIVKGEEYYLSELVKLLDGKYSDIVEVQKFFDYKVKSGHIKRREEGGEIIYYPKFNAIYFIQKGNEYSLTEIFDKSNGEFANKKEAQTYLDGKVKYGHIKRREEGDEIIYYPSTEEEKEAILGVVRLTKEVVNNIHNQSCFNPNEEIDFNEGKTA
ncbi:MAG: hypothetical protein PHG82_00795 [Candidatus Gracilibacteria bacterium]|nr:hypothetical protein [Candidatus Gracilibacteria bacterium]